MAPQRQDDDDWSDSDEDRLESGGIETSVLLGVPDGPIDVDKDAIDAAVSRIGGLPALLPRQEPPVTSSHCRACAEPMELLVQMWCPFENSPMDRALYIWGCARTGCQGKDGSIRAWRGLRFNEKYAAKLERKKKRGVEWAQIKAEKEQAAKQRIEDERKQRDIRGKPNPFSMGGVSASGKTPFGNNPFGKSAQLFGIAPLSGEAESVPKSENIHKVDNQNGKPTPEDDQSNLGNDDHSSSGSDSEESLLTALASTTLTESPWRSAPAYPPLYMSTAEEYLPPQAKPKLPKNVQVEGLGDDDRKEKEVSWAQETYEASLEVDHVFERFATRVGWKGDQCVRYELGGTPLPFASDKTFELLWPRPPQDALPVTKPDFKVVRPVKREYDTSSVPPCPACGSARVFECQLMPNLIYVLHPVWAKETKKMTDEERRKTVERALKGQDVDEKRGMEWGTCMVFSCEQDCCTEAGGKESWREEMVYVQWDV